MNKDNFLNNVNLLFQNKSYVKIKSIYLLKSLRDAAKKVLFLMVSAIKECGVGLSRAIKEKITFFKSIAASLTILILTLR